LQHILGFQLRVGILEANLDAVGIEEHPVVGDMRLGQRIFNLLLQRQIHFERGPRRRHLHRRNLAEKVGQRVQQSQQHRRGDDEIFPQRITVHSTTPNFNI